MHIYFYCHSRSVARVFVRLDLNKQKVFSDTINDELIRVRLPIFIRVLRNKKLNILVRITDNKTSSVLRIFLQSQQRLEIKIFKNHASLKKLHFKKIV